MKKLLSLLLCLAIVFSSMPVGVIAEDTQSEEPSAFSLSENQEDIIEEEPQEEVIEETIQEETEITLPEENIQVNQNNKNDKIEEANEQIEETFQLVESKLIDNIKITVNGTFAEEGTLSIKKVESQELSENNIAESHSFDIKVLNKDNQEIQPIDKIHVSFEFESISKNVDIEVYHEEEQIEAETKENVITVESDGFSVYTVEFTYENKQYVLEGDSYVKLSDILSEIGLTGEVTSYEVSNSELFDIFKGNEDYLEYIETYDEEGNLIEYYPKNEGLVLYMVALQPFTTEEWLKVVIDGIEYMITVTDAIRMDENGDQVGTNVRFMQESTAIGIITDSRVIQGPLENNFTASMPLAEIYIDDTIVNQTLWSKDEYNGDRVIAELLVDNTQGKYAGFQINTDTSAVSTDKGTLQNSYGGVWYDFSKRYLNDTQYLTVSGSSANNYELFSGDIVRYTLKGMATKFDVASNAYKNYDVVITYSDILITLCQNSGTGAVNQASISSILKLIDTNMVNFAWSGGFRAGLSYNVNVKVVDPDTGALVDGSYYYPMTDIDIGRTGIGGFANLYNASNFNRYSEQVALMSNYGRPTSSGSWEQMVWIPGGNYSAAPFTNKANVTEDNYPYTCNITSKTIDGKANTLLVSPGGTTTGVAGKITTASGVDKDNTFYSGFITLANNTAGGINVKGYASAPTSGGVESYVLTGSQIVNHKVDASSDAGGTVFTTTTGNSDGSLSGGTLLGYNEVNKPFEISAATGQSVTYTMTPKGGYKLKNVWVKDGDIDIMTIVNTAKGTISESTYDTNNDGELDEAERLAYESAVQTAINTALTNDTNANSISISNLTSLGKGVYMYTFSGIQEDKSIHIEWEKTDLTVTKKLNPTMSGIVDKFKFQIKLSDTSTEETTWRVRAKKNTNKFSHSTTVENGELYYMAYYESHSESVPYSYIAIPNTIEDYMNKNPYEEGWYYYSNGAYLQSYDTSIDEDTTYYELDSTQSSNMTFYDYHVLGWNETTQSWDEYVIPATNSITNGSELGLINLDEILSDNYRFISDGTHVYNLAAYDENSSDNDYLVWENDNYYSLTLGKSNSSNTDFASSNISHFIYAWKETVNKGDVRGYVGSGEASIDGEIYTTNSITEKYKSVVDTQNLVYYNLITNPNNYTLDSGYSHVEGESGLYIVTLPAGQTPNTNDLVVDGWDIIIGQVGAIEDNFDLEQAMINAGAKSVPGAVNTYEFELGVGETIDFNGVIPMGYNYEITEVLPSNSRWRLDSQSTNTTINDFDGEEHVIFTNAEKTFDITIEKETVGDISGTFNFTIEIYKEDAVTNTKIPYIPISLPNGFSGSNGVYTFTLNNSESKVFTDIPYGYKYEITETLPQGWENESKTNETGTLTNADVVSTWINKQKTYNLTINKETVNNVPGTFEFKVKTWREIEESYSSPLGESGSGVFSLLQEKDENNNIVDTPVTMLLMNLPGFNNIEIGEIPQEILNHPVTFSIDTGDVDEKFIDGDLEYKLFKIGILKSNGVGEFTGPFSLANNEDSIKELLSGIQPEQIKNGKGVTFENVSTGYYIVQVEENYIIPLLIIANIDDETFEPIYEYTIKGSVPFEKITSAVTKTLIDLSEQFGEPDSDGYYHFTLNNDDSLTIPNLPYGYNYEAYEVDGNGNRVLVGSNVGSTDWKLKSVDGNNTGTITDDTSVTFTNELKNGSIKINKETKGNEEGEFKFRAKVWEERTLTTNILEFTITGEEDISEIAYGHSNRITSLTLTIDEIYEKLSTLSSQRRYISINEDVFEFNRFVKNINTSDTNIVFRYGTRFVAGFDSINGREGIVFSAPQSVLLTQGDVVKIYGKSNITNYLDLTSYGGTTTSEEGVYEFTINNGENFTIDEIPFGYKYEVYEETPEGWDLVSIDGDEVKTLAEGIIKSEEPYEHTFLNAKRHKLVFEKKVSGNMGDKYKEFEFKVRVAGWTLDHRVIGEEKPYNHEYQNHTSTAYFRDDIAEQTFIFDYAMGSQTLLNGEVIEDLDEEHSGTFENGTWIVHGEAYDDGCSEDLNTATYVDGELVDLVPYMINPGDVVEFHYLLPVRLEKYGGEYDSEGWYTFTLKHGESLTIPNIPAGYTYEVVEKDYSTDGYHTYIDNSLTEGRTVSGTLNSDKSHTYTNKYDTIVPTRVTATVGGGILLLLLLVLLSYIIIRKKLGQR